MKKAFTVIELLVVVTIIGLLATISIPRFTGIQTSGKVASVKGNLKNFQTSIDMYYVGEGRYPEYGVDLGAGDGSQFSDTFEKYYTKARMAETPIGGEDISVDKAIRQSIFLLDDNTLSNLKGGWVYDEKVGKIYARLVDNAYGEGNKWIEEGELSLTTSKTYDPQILVGDDQYWSSEKEVDEFTLDTTFNIDSSGRMEIYLEGFDEDGNPKGYRLRIHPVMGVIRLMDGPNDPGDTIQNINIKKQGIKSDTWFENKVGKDVPISLEVKNGAASEKELSLSIGGIEVDFDGSNTISYTPESSSSNIGIGNRPNSNRELETGEIDLDY